MPILGIIFKFSNLLGNIGISQKDKTKQELEIVSKQLKCLKITSNIILNR